MQLRQKALQKLQQQLEAPPPLPGDSCPGCGRPSVRLLQCGWLTAVRGCDQPDCLHPLLGPVFPVARPYTDMHKLQVPPAATDADPADVAEEAASRPTTASVVGLVTSLTQVAEPSAGAASIITADDVFVRCFCPTVESLSAAAAAAALTAAIFCRAPGGSMALLRCAYRKCLLASRTAFRVSSSPPGGVSPECGGGGGRRGSFRGLILDSQMSDVIDRELAEFDASLGIELSRLMAEIGCSANDRCGPRDVLYNSLRCLFRHCARSRISLKQMCTVCFEQNTVRSRCSVLRAGCPAGDFDLSQPLKRVLLRPCASCGAPRQRVLFAWEAPGPPSVLIVESPDGVALSSSQARRRLMRGRLDLGQGLGEFAPSAVIERRRQISRQSLVSDAGEETSAFVVWLYSPESERWMAMSSDVRFACYDDSNHATETTSSSTSLLLQGDGGGSEILAVVYERVAPASANAPKAAAAAATTADDTDGAESLAQSDEDSPPPPPLPLQQQHHQFPDPASSAHRQSTGVTPTSYVSSSANRSLLSRRLRSVMRTRHLLGDYPSRPSSSAAFSDYEGVSVGGSSSGGDFVMSRFLKVVASSTGFRRASRSRRLRSYVEDSTTSHVAAAPAFSIASSGGTDGSSPSCGDDETSAAPSVVSSFATAATWADPATGSQDTSLIPGPQAEEEFDILSLFL